MKKFIILSALMFCCFLGLAQYTSRTAPSCDGGCSQLTVHVTKKTDFGVPNSTVVEVTNNLPKECVVLLFLKKRDGSWWHMGYSKKLPQGESTTFHYNSSKDDVTGEYSIYYQNYPEEKFPTTSEVTKRKNHGY